MNSLPWIMRLITWDGLLPALVWLSPYVIGVLLPNHDKAIEAAAILIPILALLFRFYLGTQYIFSNHCSCRFRKVQLVLFCIGLLLLLLIDSLMILSSILPQMPRDHPVHFKEQVFMVGFFSLYFILMIVAMYPGAAADSLDPA